MDCDTTENKLSFIKSLNSNFNSLKYAVVENVTKCEYF